MKKSLRFTFYAILVGLIIVGKLYSAQLYPDIIVKGAPWYDVRGYSTIADAITAIGASEKTLLIIGDVAVAADTTIPATTHVWYLGSGKFTVAAGKVLTHNGTISAGNNVIWVGPGTVVPPKAVLNLAWMDGLTKAVALLGSAVCEVEITSSWTQAADVTTPSTMTISVRGAGQVSVDNAKTWTIQGPIYGRDGCFQGNGKIVPSVYQSNKASWWAGFTKAVGDIGSNVRSLHVEVATVVSGNLTVPATLSLAMIGDGSLNPAGGTTLTINGPFWATTKKVFNGAGAVAGLVLSKAEWFGFAPSATATVNAAAMQAAVNALTGGGQLIFESTGTASVDNTTTLLSNVDVVGNLSLKIQQTVADKQIFSASSKSNIKFRNLWLYGLGDWVAGWAGPTGHLGRGIDLTTCSNVEITNCLIQNFSLAGIYYLNCSDVIATGNLIEGTNLYSTPVPRGSNQQFGICFDASSTGTWTARNAIFRGNVITGTAHGIETAPVSGTDEPINVLISENIIRDIPGQHGVYAVCSRSSIVNNIIYQVGSAGIKWQASTTYALYSMVISGNEITGSGFGNGLDIGSTSTAPVTGLTIGPNFISEFVYGVSLSSYVVNATVTGTNISRCYSNGLYITGAGMSNISVSNLDVKYVAGNGININPTASSGVKVTNSRVANANMLTLAYSLGTSATLARGATVTGSTSGSTATVIAVKVTSGTFAGGDAVGTILLASQSAPFVAEDLLVGGSSVCTIAGNSSAGSNYGVNLNSVAGVDIINTSVSDSETHQIYALYQVGATNVRIINSTFTNGATHDVRLDAAISEWLGNTYSTINGRNYLSFSQFADFTAQSVDATDVTLWSFTLPDESAYMITANIVGKLSGSAERAGYTDTVLIYRNGGNATKEGATTSVSLIESATWPGSYAWSVAGSSVYLKANSGGAATVVDWAAAIKMEKIY